MSRSFGARSLTCSPPIFSSPLEMSSSPALIRSAVDSPHPPRAGADAPGWLGERGLAGEEGEGGGHGARSVGGGERDREEEVVPGEDEDEHCRREHPWGR